MTIQMAVATFNHPIHALALVGVIAGISAILFTKGITGLLPDLSAWVWIGTALILMALIPMLAIFHFPDPKFITVMVIGILLIVMGL